MINHSASCLIIQKTDKPPTVCKALDGGGEGIKKTLFSECSLAGEPEQLAHNSEETYECLPGEGQ